ncbi:hypothetical protein [Sagittula sp.]|uniref:hypothetical protein n=1 Tax=Sagittula sp. TaxID=2038081 RepID=UPI003511B06C
MSERIDKLLAAASAASCATSDMIEVARDGTMQAAYTAGAVETCTTLADAMRLLLETMPEVGEEETQLHGAVLRYLEART